jgi:Mor family transcriptional regulator
MKLLTTAIFASIMAISTAACAKEEPKKVAPAAAVVVEAPKAAASVDVKKDAAPETKRVCVDIQGRDGKPVIDPKTKKPRQDCRTIKIHKKFEGTKVEDAKKK